MIKFAPKEVEKGAQGRVLQYRSNIPSSPLNMIAVDGEIILPE